MYDNKKKKKKKEEKGSKKGKERGKKRNRRCTNKEIEEKKRMKWKKNKSQTEEMKKDSE